VLFARNPELQVDAGPGWKRHLASLFGELEKVAQRRPGFRVVQVKQKLGGLRIYYAPHHDAWVSFLVREAEIACSRTCEWCGAQGELRRTDGLLATRCTKHIGLRIF
jgi:hypothetical protein